jgi:hypothetical protein
MNLSKDSARRRLYANSQRFVTTSVAVVRGEQTRNRSPGRRVSMEEEGAFRHFPDHLTEIAFIGRDLELPSGEKIVEDGLDELDLGRPAPIDGRRSDSGPSRNGGDRCRFETLFDQRLTNGSENNCLDRWVTRPPSTSSGGGGGVTGVPGGRVDLQ